MYKLRAYNNFLIYYNYNSNILVMEKVVIFFQQFEAKLQKYAYILTRSLEERDDLLSEVKIKILEKYNESEIDHFYSWAKTIMRNTHLDNIRKKYISDGKGGSFRVNENDIDDFYNYDENGIKKDVNSQKRAQCDEDLKKISIVVSREDIFYQEKFKKTMQLIQEFPSVQREIIMMHAEGYSYQEISDSLKIAKGTVMSSLCRVREKLTNQLIKSEKDE